MKKAILFTVLCFIAAVLLQIVFSYYQIYYLENYDEKWGTQSDNLTLAATLSIGASAIQAFLLFVGTLILKKSGSRFVKLSKASIVTGIVIFAGLSIWLFPPTNRSIVISVMIVVLSSLAAIASIDLFLHLYNEQKED